jgi:hypothetical protein
LESRKAGGGNPKSEAVGETLSSSAVWIAGSWFVASIFALRPGPLPFGFRVSDFTCLLSASAILGQDRRYLPLANGGQVRLVLMVGWQVPDDATNSFKFAARALQRASCSGTAVSPFVWCWLSWDNRRNAVAPRPIEAYGAGHENSRH